MVRLTNTPIIVDEFKYIPGCFIYLLTHLHTDHTSGLTPSWNNGIIFCSEITKRMLLKKFQLQEPERVIALEEDLTYYIPLVPPNPFQDHQTGNDDEDPSFRSGYVSTSNNIHSDINVWRNPSYWIKISNASATTTRQLPSQQSNSSSSSSQSNVAALTSLMTGQNNNSDHHHSNRLPSQNSNHSLSQNNVTTTNKTIQAFNSYDRDASYMQVNVIDANHCPGGIMFLLEGYFGTVLFTGDFRYDPRILQAPCFKDKKIDHLYLDDTFLDPVYDFPTRQEAGQEIIQIIKSLPEDTRILLAVDHLGKEELLIALAQTFKTLIVVPEERLELLECMSDVIPIQLFTHNPEQGRILVKSKKEVSFNSIMFHRKSYPKVVGIIPSGWSTKQLKEVKHSDSSVIYRVPYSLHSSYKELIEFVTQVRPKIVYSSSRGDNVALRDEVKHLCDNTTPMKQVIIPRSVLSHMERSTNVIDHRNSTSVSSSSNIHSLARGSNGHLIMPKSVTPNTAAGRKRKSFPPSHRILPTKLYALPTQTLNPFSNLSTTASNGTKNSEVVDLTGSTLKNNQNLMTSHHGTVFENTQDLLTNMIFHTDHQQNTNDNNFTDKNTSILSLDSQLEFSKSPSSRQQHPLTTSSISSLEALNILDDLKFSPLRKPSAQQPQSPAHRRVMMTASSPKVSPIPKLKKKKSEEIEKVLVDKTTGIQILLPKKMNHEMEVNIHDKNEELNDDEYKLSLSPHSGDESVINVDESDILQNIELESDEEESIILHTRPIHSNTTTNVKNNRTSVNKRKLDDHHYIQELSSDDDEDVVFTGSFTTSGSRNAQNQTDDHVNNENLSPACKKMKQNPSTTSTSENISDTCDLLEIGFSMEMPTTLNSNIGNREEENLYPKGYSQISWDDDDDVQPQNVMAKVETAQPQTDSTLSNNNPFMNLSSKVMDIQTASPMTSITNNQEPNNAQSMILQNNLRAKTKIPFKFDSSGGSQTSSHSSLSSIESPQYTIQSIFFSKSKK
ncbi:hypothetical protein FDP41_008783 [Naegleria fowleri]|uniref:Protein artemis n=1 Tax=Naegleria fowleri TaxID=5763 RepID=A0A6A5BEL1_NAEFO|nr:uncharacterized protein FDP41_008783 [Naegleria fowleri]KAF0972931.1 hypothetical protein FDP41_008783 [Naegleria fowleri]